MDKIEIPKKKLGKLSRNKNIVVNVVNNTTMNLECLLEMIGDNLTIWVNEKDKNNET